MGIFEELKGTSTRLLVELWGPPGKKIPPITLSKATHAFTTKAPFHSVHQKRNLERGPIHLSKHVGKKPLGAVTVSDVIKQIEKVKNRDYQIAMLRGIKKMVIYAMTGELGRDVATGTPGKKITSDFLFSVRDVKDLKDAMPCDPGTGRFATLRIALAKHIAELKDRQFGVIVPSRTVKEDDKERAAVHKQMTLFLNNNYSSMAIRWNNLDQVFVVAKKSDWERLKKNDSRL